MANKLTRGRAIVGNLIGSAGNPATFTIVNSLARTDTSAKTLGYLPVGAIVVSVEVWTGTLSNAGTSATVSIGKSGTNNYFVNAFDVKGSTVSAQNFPACSNLFSAIGPLTVVGIYAESGGASTTGGPFWACIEYYVA